MRAGAGRLPAASDRDPVIVLGHAYWQTRFGADPAVVGKTLALGGGKPVTATSLLLGVQPWDPWSIGATTIVLTASLMAATIGPAFRAASVAPSEALRNA